jgi:hypothetical protein
MQTLMQIKTQTRLGISPPPGLQAPQKKNGKAEAFPKAHCREAPSSSLPSLN